MDYAFTEAAKRIIAAAAQLAARQAATAVDPVHLLWALVEDESRAAEILGARGLNRQQLQQLCPLPAAGPRTGPQQAKTIDGVDAPQRSRVLERILEAARHQAAALGPGAEIGSEHLLFGLVQEDSPVADVLKSHGFDSSVLAKLVAESAGFSDKPIKVDIKIKGAARTPTDLTDVLRTIDAAYNRAREGLRVLEDYVRFSLDDAFLTEKLKNCRHALARGLADVAGLELLRARDTRDDVGTGIHTGAEMFRQTPADVVRANCCRVTEALRTLEEFGKVLSGAQGPMWKALRYEMYTLEKAILLAQANRSRFERCPLYVLVTESDCHHGSGPAIRGALAAGAKAIQLREKQMPVRRFLDYAAHVREWTRKAGALLIINDRPDLAVLLDADGVHVGQDDLRVREARRIVGPDRIVGVSTHTVEQAHQAVLDGADYLGVGPIFASATKQFDQYAGLELVRQVAQSISLPWFAIGGINPDNIGEVIATGAKRVAVSSAICAAEDPGAVVGQLLSRLEAG